MAAVAQSVRAPGCGPGGRGFDSRRSPFRLPPTCADGVSGVLPKGDPMADDFDPLRVLASLRSHGARYVLVGGLAAAVRGGPIETDDVDICIPRDDENYGSLALALRQLAAVPVGEDAAARSSYLTSCGPLDVIELGEEFDAFFERATAEDLGNGVTCRVASTEDLIQLKRMSGDLATVVNLVSLQQPVEDA